MSTTPTDPVTPPSIERAGWRIDPARSSVEFRTPTLWGLATVKGHFDRYDGRLDLEQSPAITLTIDAASLDTNNKLRDRHLRSADFFDVGNHPQVGFISDSATLSGGQLNVRGTLSAAGNSVILALDATLRRVGDELEVDVSAYVDHRKLGMTHSTLGMIRTPTQVIVHGRLVQDESSSRTAP